MLTSEGARGPSRTDAGLSLVEVMVAMAVFTIGSLSLLSVLTSSSASTYDNRARLVAANLAAADIDEARSTAYDDLTVGTTTFPPVVVDGRSYTVTRRVAVTTASGTSGTSACVASGSSRQLHKRISTNVRTSFRSGTNPVRADTIVRAPVFDPSNPKGAIGFLVMDRAGEPLSGLPVAVPATSSTTDSSGCAFLDALSPGTYTVTVTRPGSVTRDGRSTLTKPVTVYPGQITSESLRVHGAISVVVRARAFTGSTVASGTWNVPSSSVTLTAPDRATPTALALLERKALTGGDLTWASSVYPSPGGYDAHLGPCTPLTHFDSEPSISPTLDLPLSPIVVHFRGSSDGTGRNTSLTATWVPTGGAPPCAEVLTFAVTTASDCQGQQSLDAGRPCVLNVALPAGRWTLRPSGANGATTSLTGATTFTVASRTANNHVDLDVS